MTILTQKAYKLNHSANSFIEVSIEDDFELYILELIKEVQEDLRSKEFKFPTFSTGLKSDIELITNDNIEEAFNNICYRLIAKENDVQEEIKQLKTEVQKGILVQAYIEVSHNINCYTIIKSEEFEFIDEEIKKKKQGFPVKKKVFKSFCGFFSENKEILSAKVGDSNSKISTYWHRDFLELEAIHDDTFNTNKCFEILDKKIFPKVRKTSAEDYMYLRNATVHYFRNNNEFVMQDYIGNVIDTYVPVNNKVNIKELKESISTLPDKNGFDTRFSIDKDSLKQRIINKIKLTNELYLEIKEDINWEGVVTAVEEFGIKYIKIRSETGYEYFKKA